MDKFIFLSIGFLLIFQVVQLSCLDDVPGEDYNVYHRHSEEVIGVMGNADLPEKGTPEYYLVWAAHDQRRHRQLSSTTHKDLPALTFAGGDVTTRIATLGFFHYARIYVGTPPVPFLVALDTGSVLFWLPCRCKDCTRSFKMSPEEVISLNSYEPGSSSTSEVVPCSSSYCFGSSSESCPLYGPTPTLCTYEYPYMSPNTSTKGFLVEDVMYLETYSSNVE